MASGLVDLGDHPAVQQLRAVLQAFGSEDKQQGDHQKAVQELRALVRASEIPGLAEDTQARLRAVKDDLMHLLDGAVHVVDDVKACFDVFLDIHFLVGVIESGAELERLPGWVVSFSLLSPSSMKCDVCVLQAGSSKRQKERRKGWQVPLPARGREKDSRPHRFVSSLTESGKWSGAWKKVRNVFPLLSMQLFIHLSSQA